jgi:hypothetical protein
MKQDMTKVTNKLNIYEIKGQRLSKISNPNKIKFLKIPKLKRTSTGSLNSNQPTNLSIKKINVFMERKQNQLKLSIPIEIQKNVTSQLTIIGNRNQ